MSKRKSSIKKKILFPVLLGLVTLSSTAMATLDPGHYNGTTKHYRKGKEADSPVLGAAGLVVGLVENIRFSGPYTPAYNEDGSRDYAGDTSDNPSWNIVNILFPSTGGNLASEANFETSFGNNVDKVQTIEHLLSFVNDLREGKDVNVEAVKNALFLTLKKRPPYDSQKEQADLETVKKEVPEIQATTKADFIKALRGLDINPNLKKEMIGYATNKYKPKVKPNDLDAGRLGELKGFLIGLADRSINATIQKKQKKQEQEDEKFRKLLFQKTLTPLIESIQQAVENEKDSIFPAYTTEQLIESFFSHKFNTEKDINNLIEATPDDIVDPNIPFEKTPLPLNEENLTEEEIEKETARQVKEILDHTDLDMDDFLALFALGMGGAPVPYQLGLPLISNGEKAWFYDRAKDQFNKDIKFSDCVDEMPRHMANMLLYDRKTQAFNVKPLLDQQKKFEEGTSQFKRIQNAIEFFKEYQPPMMANNGTTETRSLWNRVIADLNFDGIGPKVDYVKHKNELDTGHINMLRMFQNLFSLDLDPFPALEVVNEADPEKEKEALIQILQKKRLNVDPFPALEAKAEATPEQEQEAQAKLDKDILNWKTKSRENIQKKFEEDRINWILSSFRKVFSFMNPDFVYDFKSENLSWSPTRNDVMGDITVFVKKSEKSTAPLYSFIMKQKDGHGVVTDIAYTQNQAALEIETKPAAIEPHTAEESLWLLFPQLAKTKTTEPLYQMMPRLLADNDSKIDFISRLQDRNWQSTPPLAAQEIAGFLSNILPTLGWDDPDTLRRITSSIRGVILDKDENLNEAVPAEIREAFFKQTKSLEFGAPIKPNFMRVLLEFNSDVLETQNSKMNFLQGLNGLDWKEISEENTSKMTGLLSNVLDTLTWGSKATITNYIVDVFLDKDGKLKGNLPQEIQEVFFQHTQSLEFPNSITWDVFLELNKILPQFEKAKDIKLKVSLCKSQVPSCVFTEDHRAIEELNFENSEIQNITGLEHLTQLRKINLSRTTKLTSIKFFQSNEMLESIVGTRSSLENIEGLSHLPNLKLLHLYQSQIKSLEFSSQHKNLETMNLGISSIKSVRGLGHLKGLNDLCLFRTPKLESITFEDELPKLSRVWAEKSSLKELKGLDKLPNVTSLLLGNTPNLNSLRLTDNNKSLETIDVNNSGISAIEGVESLPQLKSVEAANTSHLGSLTFGTKNEKLEKVDLSGSGVTSIRGIEELSALKTLEVPNTSRLESLTFGTKNEKLEKVDSSHSGVKTIEGVQELPALKTLTLNGSKDLASPIHFSQKNANLNEVNLSDTAVTQVSGVEYLKHIGSLKLENLELESLEDFPNLMYDQTSLSGSSVGLLKGLELLTYEAIDEESVNVAYFPNFISNMKSIEKIVFEPSKQIIKKVTLFVSESQNIPPSPLLKIGSIEGLENFKDLKVVYISNVALHSLKFTQDLEKLQSIKMPRGELAELEGLEHLPALKEVIVPSMGPEKIDLPEDVAFSQSKNPQRETEIKHFKRPSVGKIREEND